MFLKTMPIRFENVEPNKETMLLIWNAVCKSRRYKEAQYVFDIMLEQEAGNRAGFGTVKADMYRSMVRLASYWKDVDGVVKYLQAMKDKGLKIRGRDRAYLAMVAGTKAEQLEARRRFNKESIRRRKDVTIREKAGKHGSDELSFRYWKHEKRVAAEKQAGLRLKQPQRIVGKVYWN